MVAVYSSAAAGVTMAAGSFRSTTSPPTAPTEKEKRERERQKPALGNVFYIYIYMLFSLFWGASSYIVDHLAVTEMRLLA